MGVAGMIFKLRSHADMSYNNELKMTRIVMALSYNELNSVPWIRYYKSDFQHKYFQNRAYYAKHHI